jgi:hypothetical protein
MPSRASNTMSSTSSGSQNPALRGFAPVLIILCVCLEACPASALAKPTPTRPMQGPSTGVAQDTLHTKPTSLQDE